MDLLVMNNPDSGKKLLNMHLRECARGQVKDTEEQKKDGTGVFQAWRASLSPVAKPFFC